MYNNNPHPLIKINPECKHCDLGVGESVGGAGPLELGYIKLIIISDHPGHYETKFGYPFYSNQNTRLKDKIPKSPTAGALLRTELTNLLGINTWEQVWSTNAVKCNPLQKTLEFKHIKTCYKHWLNTEFNVLDNYAPTAPILVAGRHALKAMSLIAYGYIKSTAKLTEYRRAKGLFYKDHPIIVTCNPATVTKSIQKVENYKREEGTKILRAIELDPMVGSPLWIFRKDLELLKECVTL